MDEEEREGKTTSLFSFYLALCRPNPTQLGFCEHKICVRSMPTDKGADTLVSKSDLHFLGTALLFGADVFTADVGLSLG